AHNEGCQWLDAFLSSADGTSAANGGAYFIRGFLGVLQSDPDAAGPALERAVELARTTGPAPLLSRSLAMASIAAMMAGDHQSSRRLLDQAEGATTGLENDVSAMLMLLQARSLDALGCHAASSGQAPRAAQLLGAAETVRSGAGASIIGVLAPLVSEATRVATAALGASKFQAEFTAGQHVHRGEAIAQALGDAAHVAGAATNTQATAPLGNREAEVAQLVAEGLSNKDIGARLFISERTVDSHIRSILNKLGFNSRAQRSEERRVG